MLRSYLDNNVFANAIRNMFALGFENKPTGADSSMPYKLGMRDALMAIFAGAFPDGPLKKAFSIATPPMAVMADRALSLGDGATDDSWFSKTIDRPALPREVDSVGSLLVHAFEAGRNEAKKRREPTSYDDYESWRRAQVDDPKDDVEMLGRHLAWDMTRQFPALLEYGNVGPAWELRLDKRDPNAPLLGTYHGDDLKENDVVEYGPRASCVVVGVDGNVADVQRLMGENQGIKRVVGSKRASGVAESIASIRTMSDLQRLIDEEERNDGSCNPPAGRGATAQDEAKPEASAKAKPRKPKAQAKRSRSKKRKQKAA